MHPYAFDHRAGVHVVACGVPFGDHRYQGCASPYPISRDAPESASETPVVELVENIVA